MLDLKKIRNIGLAAHIDAGKTTTTERILYYTGRVHRMGEVDEGTATMDYMDLERERGITITAAATYATWKGWQINIIDTPGHVDFTIEVERSMRVLDGVIVVLSAVEGVQPQTETVWRQANRYRVPRIAFINKMDRTGADYFRVLREASEELGIPFVPVQVPVGQEAAFRGIIDVIERRQYLYTDELGTRVEEQEIAPEYRAKVEEMRLRVIELACEVDEELEARFICDEPISPEDIRRALRKGTIAMRLVPAFCGSALKNKGIQLLLDGVVEYLPSPLDLPPIRGWHPQTNEEVIRHPNPSEPLAALAFKVTTDPFVGRLVYVRVYSGVLRKGDLVLNATRKTRERVGRIVLMHANYREDVDQLVAGQIGAVVGLRKTYTGDTLCDERHPVLLEPIHVPETVISVAIEPRSQADSDRLAKALHKLADEDPTFKAHFDEETGQTIISGMGELHLEIIVSRLQREFGVQARVGQPQVAYKETLSRPTRVEGKYIRQTGGRGQYGHVVIEFEPIAADRELEFENRITQGRIPENFIPPVEAGLREAMRAGGPRGYPVVGIRARLVDGSYHEVDSSDVAFKLAAMQALREALRRGGSVLLEPIMRVEVSVPPEFVGDVLSDLKRHRAQITRLETHADQPSIIQAQVPLAEMFGYASRLRTMTQGKGTFTMEFLRYEPAPEATREKVTAS